MSQETTKLNISLQKQKVFGKQPELNLSSPCRIGDGILKLSVQDKDFYTQVFNGKDSKYSFFVPASGSGSRMFQFLYDFITNPDEENRGLIERFLNHLQEFAFFKELPENMQQQIIENNIDLEKFIEFLLNDKSMAYSKIPKAVIPFHKFGPFILNPIQEHILQGTKLSQYNPDFHFTIQKEYEHLISEKIASMKVLTGTDYQVSYSTQNPNSNAIAFDYDGNVALDNESNVVERPSGHGALLENLNEIKTELIFIRNIDNVQHFSKSNAINESWRIVGGICLQFRKELKHLMDNPSMQNLISLNEHYQLFQEKDIQNQSLEDLLVMLKRPTRVCGMVKNEGQSGGGPFWVENEGVNSKQIVEKAQISKRPDQYKLMVQSTHFNPVIIALNVFDMQNNKYDLNEFKDESQYFVVNKKYQGKDVKFCEMPGLWNGCMAKWNTIFVELPNDLFTPVKTILDLLNPLHTEV